MIVLGRGHSRPLGPAPSLPCWPPALPLAEVRWGRCMMTAQVAHALLGSGLCSPQPLGYLFSLLNESPDGPRQHCPTNVLRQDRGHHRYLATFPPHSLELLESTKPTAVLQWHPSNRCHSFPTLHQAKASREALLGRPKGEELPQHPNPSSDEPHSTLPKGTLAFEVGTSCFLGWNESMSSSPTSIWPLKHPKMTMKGSSGKSPEVTESGELREGLCLSNLSCHLAFAISFPHICLLYLLSYQLFITTSTPTVSDLMP